MHSTVRGYHGNCINPPEPEPINRALLPAGSSQDEYQSRGSEGSSATNCFVAARLRADDTGPALTAAADSSAALHLCVASTAPLKAQTTRQFGETTTPCFFI